MVNTPQPMRKDEAAFLLLIGRSAPLYTNPNPQYILLCPREQKSVVFIAAAVAVGAAIAATGLLERCWRRLRLAVRSSSASPPHREEPRSAAAAAAAARAAAGRGGAAATTTSVDDGAVELAAGEEEQYDDIDPSSIRYCVGQTPIRRAVATAQQQEQQQHVEGL